MYILSPYNNTTPNILKENFMNFYILKKPFKLLYFYTRFTNEDLPKGRFSEFVTFWSLLGTLLSPKYSYTQPNTLSFWLS